MATAEDMNVEEKLGYDRVRGQIEELCTTEGGRIKFGRETFSDDPKVVTRRLRLAEELRQVLMMEEGFVSGEYYDIEAVLKKAKIEGGFLVVEQVVLLKMALETVGELVRFFKKREREKYPELIAMSESVDDFEELTNHINTIVDRFGEIRDSASAELYRLRKAIRSLENKASKQLQKILVEAQRAGIVEADANISIRNGKAVIPVMAANKRKLKGFVQDESATGQTVYIEPVEVVEINNELRELEYNERREIVRILTEFTDLIRPDIFEIKRSGEYLTTMDMIRAKARFATNNGCVMPIMSLDGSLTLREARHLLLEQTLKKEKRKVVPLNLTLTREKHMLIISGPNAGGKSVCLKTVGLCQWMFQCGMLVAMKENSELPLFDNIYIDIGDDQSIDNDLSTYSSHLHNMKNMLHNAGSNSLLLIDEFGTGTEPVIGGAIAESLLERFESKRCYGVITTHYSNLKYYASSAQGVVNGAMTFDVQNIEPLFTLEMGAPGSSFAIEIARKIGLSEDIIRSASEKIGSDQVSLERQLRDIARDKRYWEQKRHRIRIADRKVEELEQEYGEQLSDIKQQRAKILKEARQEAERITVEANRQIESVIRTIRESQADKELTHLARKDLDEFKESIDEKTEQGEEPRGDRAAEKIEREMNRLIERQRRREERRVKRGEELEKGDDVVGQSKSPIRLEPEVGSKVRMAGQNVIGEVQEIKGRRGVVAFGQILTTVELSKLEVVTNLEYKTQNRPKVATIALSEDISKRRLNFNSKIDVRGMRVEEALITIRDFIDDATMVGMGEVMILHGKGTGALKEEIRGYLQGVNAVSSVTDEHPDRGGAGITIVRFAR